MTDIKALFFCASLFLFAAAPATAAELNALRAADVPAAEVPFPAARAMADSIFSEDGRDPVVITVPGLSFAEIGPANFEFRYILKLIRFFFPKRSVPDAAVAEALESARREHFMLDEDELYQPVNSSRVPDNYIEEKLKELPGYAEHDLVVVPFRWSRDPDDSDETVPLLAERIAQVYDAYKGTGRPVYILAHSWGTMLSHSAMHRLARTRPDVRVKRWITMGSPLSPGNFIVKIFVKIGIRKEELEKAVSKPAMVGQWRNIWAERDPASNAIKPADENTRVDGAIDDIEPTLIDLILHNKPLRKDAKNDLLKVRSFGDWHGAYFYDYRANLRSIHKEIYIPVFAPVLAPQITGPAE